MKIDVSIAEQVELLNIKFPFINTSIDSDNRIIFDSGITKVRHDFSFPSNANPFVNKRFLEGVMKNDILRCCLIVNKDIRIKNNLHCSLQKRLDDLRKTMPRNRQDKVKKELLKWALIHDLDDLNQIQIKRLNEKSN